jgi:predicted HTH transcriptional regulator
VILVPSNFVFETFFFSFQNEEKEIGEDFCKVTNENPGKVLLGVRKC